jgi:hypothetical protein
MGDEHEPARRYEPLAPSIDHIVPKSRGGTNDGGNLQNLALALQPAQA